MGFYRGRAGCASDERGLAEVLEKKCFHQRCGVREFGEFEYIRRNASDLSATSSEGLVRQATDVSETR